LLSSKPPPKTATVVNTLALPKTVANLVNPVLSPSMVPRAQMNAILALLVPLPPMRVPINALNVLLVLLKAKEPNVLLALLVPTPLQLLRLLKNAMPAPLVLSPRIPVQPPA